MISKYVKEQKRLTQEDLSDIFECSEDHVVFIIKKLKEFGVLKAVRAIQAQKDRAELSEEEIEIADVEAGDNAYLYVCTFVGVITVGGCVLKCYPKYIQKTTELAAMLKQVLRVLEKFNSQEQIIWMYNESSEGKSFNLLAVLLYLLHDFYESGLYTNVHDVIETNGAGEILWDKTINDTFTLIRNQKPYYFDLLTKKRVTDEYDYFKRLHECVLSRATAELKQADLIELFDIMPVELSEETLDDFGDRDYILYRIENELSIQFNTRKQLLLKTIYAYVKNDSGLYDTNIMSMFGTNNFHRIWEKVCAEALDNQLNTPLAALQLPVSLRSTYESRNLLISLIEKPL